MLNNTPQMKESLEEIYQVIESFNYVLKDPDTGVSPASLISLCKLRLIKTAKKISLYLETPNITTPDPTQSDRLLQNTANIGERISGLRKLRAMTFDDLANALNVSAGRVSAWESGLTIPGSDEVIPLANALKCDPMWLLTGEPVETAEE